MMSWIFIQGDVNKLPKHILDDISQRQRRYDTTCKNLISSSTCITCYIYHKQRVHETKVLQKFWKSES